MTFKARPITDGMVTTSGFEAPMGLKHIAQQPTDRVWNELRPSVDIDNRLVSLNDALRIVKDAVAYGHAYRQLAEFQERCFVGAHLIDFLDDHYDDREEGMVRRIPFQTSASQYKKMTLEEREALVDQAYEYLEPVLDRFFTVFDADWVMVSAQSSKVMSAGSMSESPTDDEKWAHVETGTVPLQFFRQEMVEETAVTP